MSYEHYEHNNYEAKAKAWDKYKSHMERHIAGETNEEELVSDLKSDYFESVEPEPKKSMHLLTENYNCSGSVKTKNENGI